MTFATAINCMDGRVQMPVLQHIKSKYSVDFVDTITLPGPNKVLAEGEDISVLDSVKKCLEISLTRHHSNLIAICGHHDCAGNPSPREIQIQHIKEAISRIQSWNPGVPVIGLWVNQNGEVEEV